MGKKRRWIDMDPDDWYEHGGRKQAINESELKEISEAEEAAKKLKNQSEIIDVILNGKIKSARKIAADKLTDEDAIVDILMKTRDSHIVGSLLNHVSNQQTLKKLVTTAEYFSVKFDALEKIDDQSILIDIARDDGAYSVRSDAAKRITDPVVLLDLLKDVKPAVRWSAIRAETEQKLLEELLKSDTDSYVRRRVAEHVNDKEILKEAAVGDVSIDVREYIINERLFRDKELLAEIAGRSEDYKTCLAANMALHSARGVRELIEITEDLPLLRGIAENDEIDNRLLALRRIDDEEFKQKVLGEIALNQVYDYKTNYRFEAIKNLTDDDIRQKALGNISVNAENLSTRSYAARLLAELISDGKLKEADLASMAKTNPVNNVRLSALRKVQSPETLADIALHAESRRIRHMAAERISDQEVNKRLYCNSKGNSVKNIVLSKITDRDFVLNLSFDRPSELKRARRLSPAMNPLEGLDRIPKKPDSTLMKILANAEAEAAGRPLCVEHIYIALLLFYQKNLLEENWQEMKIDVLPTLFLLRHVLKHGKSFYKPRTNTDYYLNRAAELVVLTGRTDSNSMAIREIEPRDLIQAIEKEPTPLIYRCSIYCKIEAHKKRKTRWNYVRWCDEWCDEWYYVLKANPTPPDNVEAVVQAFLQNKAWASRIPM